MKFPIESEWHLQLVPDTDEAKSLLSDHLFAVLDALIEYEDNGSGVEDADLSLSFGSMRAVFTFTIDVDNESPSVDEVQMRARGTLRAAIHTAKGRTPAQVWESGAFTPCRLAIVSEDELTDDDDKELVEA